MAWDGGSRELQRIKQGCFQGEMGSTGKVSTWLGVAEHSSARERNESYTSVKAEHTAMAKSFIE